MTAEHARIFAAKAAERQRLAALPIAEKLRLLDQMREREVALRAARPARERQADAAEPKP